MVREVSAVLARIDPAGLTEAGVPDDEYEMEAGQLVRRVINEADGPEDVQRIASEILDGFLGPGCDANLDELGREVWNRFQQERGHSDLGPPAPSES